MGKEIIIKTEQDLKLVLAKEYQKQVENFFGDSKQALKFLSSVASAVQRNPKLLECTSSSLINSFMTMAQLQLMPSEVSGEAYVIPYKNKGVMEAQYQTGYQGFVTLFYRAGITKVYSDIVHEKDHFTYRNGEVDHSINPLLSKEERGEAIGAYAIVSFKNEKISKWMNKTDILKYKEFSKTKNSEYSPWLPKNDPSLWMWQKTVIKQIAKLLPKNETISQAIAEDNKDSIIHIDRADKTEQATSLKMGALLKQEELEESVYENNEVDVTDQVIEKVVDMSEDKPQCHLCATIITDKVLEFSQKKYKKPLCFNCQKTV